MPRVSLHPFLPLALSVSTDMKVFGYFVFCRTPWHH
jgi:hypothetical protein